MNERLDTFRKRLRGPEKEKTNWQFWIGSPTAWLALAVSSTTAFFTLLYHSDILSVAMDSPVIHLTGTKKLEISIPPSILFINSGSRPIAVTNARVRIVQATEKQPDPTCNGTLNFSAEQSFGLTLEESVIKPYDTASKPIKFSGKNAADERQTMELTDFNRSQPFPKGSKAAVCITFLLVASDAASWRKTVDFGVQRVNLPGVSESRVLREPVYLMKQNRFWTEVEEDPPLFGKGSRR